MGQVWQYTLVELNPKSVGWECVCAGCHILQLVSQSTLVPPTGIPAPTTLLLCAAGGPACGGDTLQLSARERAARRAVTQLASAFAALLASPLDVCNCMTCFLWC